MHTFTLAVIGKNLWNGIPILEKFIRTVAIYFGLVILLRIGGKRDMAQLNSFDLVVLLLLSNVVQNAVIGNDTSLSGGLLGAAILVAVNGVTVRVARASERGIRLFECSPTTLVTDGTILQAAIRRLGLRRGDVRLALRKQGATSIGGVQEAVLEPGGALLVELKADEEVTRIRDLRDLEARLDTRLTNLQASMDRLQAS